MFFLCPVSIRQIHSCEAYIFCRTVDFATGYTICVHGNVRRADPAKFDRALVNITLQKLSLGSAQVEVEIFLPIFIFTNFCSQVTGLL